MENIHKVAGKKLVWTQPHMSRREFELKSEENVYATLKWEKPFGSLAAAHAAHGDWTFKRQGFLHPSVSVRSPGSDEDIAIFRPSWTGSGTLDFNSGRQFSWVNKSFFRTEWAFLDKSGEVLHFKTKQSLLKMGAEIEIIRDMPETSVLAALGMYLMVLMRDDTAAASAAVVAST